MLCHAFSRSFASRSSCSLKALFSAITFATTTSWVRSLSPRSARANSRCAPCAARAASRRASRPNACCHASARLRSKAVRFAWWAFSSSAMLRRASSHAEATASATAASRSAAPVAHSRSSGCLRASCSATTFAIATVCFSCWAISSWAMLHCASSCKEATASATADSRSAALVARSRSSCCLMASCSATTFAISTSCSAVLLANWS
mmetsp:Transcript_44088/g.111644  ORF Transcript_44088/g.111644 Transcript_44088/m.111644 type:complete len:207 (-) Transcript_44088:657-1277(-)